MRSYRTVSPLPPHGGGGLFSVALSRGSPRVAVSHHFALWSPDVPRHPQKGRRGRLANSPGVSLAVLLRCVHGGADNAGRVPQFRWDNWGFQGQFRQELLVVFGHPAPHYEHVG